MPQRSYPFANGRLSVISTRLLDAAFLNRLADAEQADAAKLLRDAGYGSGAQDAGDVEQLIAAELSAARALIWELTPAPEVLKLFLLRTDTHNLKTLLKAKLFDQPADGLMMEGGAFPVSLLESAVNGEDAPGLPAPFAAAIQEAREIAQKQGDSGLVSAAVDRAVFQIVAQSKDAGKGSFTRQYFSAQADFTNVQSLIRAKALGWDAERMAPMLVSGGEIPEKTFSACLELPVEQLAVRLNKGACGPAIAKALEEYAQTGSMAALERGMDRAQMAMVRAGKREIFGMGPLVGYLLGREAEARAIRVIFAAKLAAAPVPALPELYA